ncbi:hypothetical protein L873DRAFT_1807777 [Choiromyces venosus 120613-1]|uniref:Uncharacterized protein n=1 Tax=Choiromyces venosus 120613-1 TaxID=1336337 RepID=A0A3N4JKF0_9PEZI|nr:hypothetical protein L873DRAFT_1807777 [Choiromyces venosus 120613-1]
MTWRTISKSTNAKERRGKLSRSGRLSINTTIMSRNVPPQPPRYSVIPSCSYMA